MGEEGSRETGRKPIFKRNSYKVGNNPINTSGKSEGKEHKRREVGQKVGLLPFCERFRDGEYDFFARGGRGTIFSSFLRFGLAIVLPR